MRDYESNLPAGARRRLQPGFTLLELMVALVVVAILVTLAVPSLRAYVLNTRITGNTNTLVAALNYARSEAITRRDPVCVCASNDSATCTNTAWPNGWIVFTDNGATCTVDGSDSVLRVQQALDSGITLTLDQSSVRFLASGALTSHCLNCAGTHFADETRNLGAILASRLLSVLVPEARADDDNDDGDDDDSSDDDSSDDDDDGDDDDSGDDDDDDGDDDDDDDGDGDDDDDNGGNGGGVTGPVTFTMCIGGKEEGRSIVVGVTGQIRVDTVACP